MSEVEVSPGAAFWREALALHGSATTRVLPRTLVFALVAYAVTRVHRSAPWLTIRPDVMETSGLVLGLLLVFRTAAGYERWWEARKLWGSILNQSRNLAVAAAAYGPVDAARNGAITGHVELTRPPVAVGRRPGVTDLGTPTLQPNMSPGAGSGACSSCCSIQRPFCSTNTCAVPVPAAALA